MSSIWDEINSCYSDPNKSDNPPPDDIVSENGYCAQSQNTEQQNYDRMLSQVLGVAQSGFDPITRAAIFGSEATPPPIANGQLSFADNIYRSSCRTSSDNKNSSNTAGITGWFHNMESALSGIGKHVNGSANGPFDWFFKTSDGHGSDTSVGAKNGNATFSGKNQDGVGVNMNVNQREISGTAGDAQMYQDKLTKDSKYSSGNYDVEVQPGMKKVVDRSTGQTFSWNSQSNQGAITDKSGNTVMSFDSQNNLTQQLGDGTNLTQTNASADQATAAVAQKMQNGEVAQQTQVVVDNKGNYGVVHTDGTVVETSKKDDAITVKKGHDEIRVHDHHVEQLVDGEWKKIKGHHKIDGLEVDEHGNVKDGNKTIVDSKGQVQADGKTTIDTQSGKMQTATSAGDVTVTNKDNKTTVEHKGVGKITNDGHSFVNTDGSTQSVFQSWDPNRHEMKVMGGANGSGVTLDAHGNVNVKESSGQTTSINENGTMTSKDAHGHTLFNVDQNGNVFMFDGTIIGADGSISNRYGHAMAWDGGSQAEAAIAKANGAVAQASGAINNYTGDTSCLGDLNAADVELSALAQQYSTNGAFDVVNRLHGAHGEVVAARDAINARATATKVCIDTLGNARPELTQMIISSGLPPEKALELFKQKGVLANSDAA